MVVAENSFVLIGMEHVNENVGEILAAARKNFPSGSKVLVEMPESGIVTAQVIEAFARGGVLNQELRQRAMRFPPLTNNKRATAWLSELVEKNTGVSAEDRKLLISNMETSFHSKLICGLKKAGIEPVAGESRYAHDREEWVIDEPLRERFFINRIKKRRENGVVGALYGSAHVGRMQKQLIQLGVPVRTVRVESWKQRVAQRLQYLAMPQNVIRWAWWKKREIKKAKIRKRK